MTDDYTTIPASEVKAGDIIHWASVHADVEVLSVGHGFYGYTFDVRHRGEVEQARCRDDEKVQVRQPEPTVRRQNTSEAMTALYGPAAAHSEYSRFTRVRYREAGKETTGLIIWICEATKDSPLLYW